jgi:hypothetical protein
MSKVHTGGNAAEGISSAAISENKVRVMMPETRFIRRPARKQTMRYNIAAIEIPLGF